MHTTPGQVQVSAQAQVFGTAFVEVIAPVGQGAIRLEGWRVRVWPQARLGDVTLEATPEAALGWLAGAQNPAAALLSALEAAGFTPIGQPVLRSEAARAGRSASSQAATVETSSESL